MKFKLDENVPWKSYSLEETVGKIIIIETNQIRLRSDIT